MKSILVLTDFSDAAFHAAEFACSLSRSFKSRRIILFNACQHIQPLAGQPIVAYGKEDLRRESLDTLEIWQESLSPLADPGTSVNFLFDEVDLIKGVNGICKDNEIDLVVMGIRGKSNLEKRLIGSNVISVMASVSHPLLVVPQSAGIKMPGKIVLATDLKHVAEKMNGSLLEELLSGLPAKLLVLNVTEKEVFLPELRNEISALHALLDVYSPEIHYINHPDIAEGISDFTLARQAGLIITIHDNQRGISGWFHKSVSKKLAWHTQVPLLVLPHLSRP